LSDGLGRFGPRAGKDGKTAAPPGIAAASDLEFALEEIAAQFREATGQEAKLTFGSSGNFYTQISQGAPFEMFMSADERFVRQLAEAGKTVDADELYAIGRIVLFAPKGSPTRARGLSLKPAVTLQQLNHS
jgi:molybdate transport system substrate-binding protein